MILRALLLGSTVAWSLAACTGNIDDTTTQETATYCDQGVCNTYTEIGADAGIDSGSDAGSADAGSDGGH
jgi:hypothetical protein